MQELCYCICYFCAVSCQFFDRVPCAGNQSPYFPWEYLTCLRDSYSFYFSFCSTRLAFAYRCSDCDCIYAHGLQRNTLGLMTTSTLEILLRSSRLPKRKPRGSCNVGCYSKNVFSGNQTNLSQSLCLCNCPMCRCKFLLLLFLDFYDTMSPMLILL